MKHNIFTLTILTILVTTSCAKKPVSPVAQDPKPIVVDAKSKMVIEGSNRFGFELFRGIWQQEDAGKNLMISPLSVELALAMTYNGAGGTTKEAFEKVLHVDELPAQDLNTSLHDLTKALLEVDPRVTMEIANSIWYRNTFHVEDVFLETNKKYFDAEIRPLDFDNPRSIGIINGWVDEKTHHKIPEIVDEIDASSVMFLINAVYFNGKWKYSFDRSKTENSIFNLPDRNRVQIPFMVRTGNILLTHNDLIAAIELPYGRGNYSMVLMIPMTHRTLDEVVEALTPDYWDRFISTMDTFPDLTIYVPKFTFSYDKKLNDPLTRLGLGVAFSGDADFSGINPEAGLAISEVKHKTFIKVDEEGTEAAAVTSVEIRNTSVEVPAVFVIDHPFLFVIKERYTGTILFMGRVSDPSDGSAFRITG
jgi:serpin B